MNIFQKWFKEDQQTEKQELKCTGNYSIQVNYIPNDEGDGDSLRVFYMGRSRSYYEITISYNTEVEYDGYTYKFDNKFKPFLSIYKNETYEYLYDLIINKEGGIVKKFNDELGQAIASDLKNVFITDKAKREEQILDKKIEEIEKHMEEQPTQSFDFIVQTDKLNNI